METMLQNNRTRTKEVTLECKHIFSQDELSALMMEMAEANYEAERAEDEKKEVVAQYKARIETHESRRKSAGGKIRAGYELRPTACRQVVDYDKGTMTVYRLDTAEIVSERRLTPAESQITMNFQDGMEAGQGGFWPVNEVPAEVVDESTGEAREREEVKEPEGPAGDAESETEPAAAPDEPERDEAAGEKPNLRLVGQEADTLEEAEPDSEQEPETKEGTDLIMQVRGRPVRIDGHGGAHIVEPGYFPVSESGYMHFAVCQDRFITEADLEKAAIERDKEIAQAKRIPKTGKGIDGLDAETTLREVWTARSEDVPAILASAKQKFVWAYEKEKDINDRYDLVVAAIEKAQGGDWEPLVEWAYAEKADGMPMRINAHGPAIEFAKGRFCKPLPWEQEEVEEETQFGPKSCPGCDEMLKNHESGKCPVCGMQINTD